MRNFLIGKFTTPAYYGYINVSPICDCGFPFMVYKVFSTPQLNVTKNRELIHPDCVAKRIFVFCRVFIGHVGLTANLGVAVLWCKDIVLADVFITAMVCLYGVTSDARFRLEGGLLIFSAEVCFRFRAS